MRFSILLLLPVLSSTARADDDAAERSQPPQLAAPKTPDTLPKLSIVSPAMDAVMSGHQTRSPDDQYESLDCLQDSKKFSIKIAAQNWSVKPGGPGVLVVVDGVYATVLHDLSKPVMLAALEPYEHTTFTNDGTFAVQYPMYACGEHWIAVVPTAADGRMLRVAPVVSWWRNVSPEYKGSLSEEDDGRRKVRQSFGLPVVNWPLIGALYVGTSWAPTEQAHRSGLIVAEPKHVVLDYTVARGAPDPDQPTTCVFKIAAQDSDQSWNDKLELPSTGTVVLPASYAGKALAIDSETCGHMSEYYSMLWTKQPSVTPRYTWPVPGSAKQLDYWHSNAGHSQFNNMVKSQREKCDNGKGDCQYGHTKPTKP